MVQRLNLTTFVAFTALAAMLTTAVFLQKAKPKAFELADMETLAGEVYNGNLTGLHDLPLTNAAIEKLTYELKGIISKPRSRQNCQVYTLNARRKGNYPLLASKAGIVGQISLQGGQVWKVGKTCGSEKTRYDGKYGSGLSKRNLIYNVKFDGSETECLIYEKILIYSYPLWSGINLPKPPGNKIYR